jgi:hypothetical protein
MIEHRGLLKTFAVLAFAVSLISFCQMDPEGPDVLCDGPGPVINIYPEDQDTIHETSVMLEWTCNDQSYDETFLEELIYYDIFFGERSGQMMPVAENLPDSFYTIDYLVPSTWYICSVYPNYLDVPVSTNCGVTWDFFVSEEVWPPGTPYDPSPASGAVDVAVDTDLSWSVYNPNGDVFSFDVYLDTLPDPELVVEDLDMTAYDPGILMGEKTYYWKVVVFSSPADSVAGPTWTFATISSQAEGVYARITFTSDIYYELFAIDEIRVRFDSSYAPYGPIDTLQADSVLVNGNQMDWNAYFGYYSYSEDPSLPWLVEGGAYVFNVYGNDFVPDLIRETEYLACSPMITSPASTDTVSINGFTTLWENFCPGFVTLVFIENGVDTTDVEFFTENDGQYDFDADDLAPLQGDPRYLNLAVIFQQSQNISAPGYDSRSEIYMRCNHSVLIYLEQ